LSGSADPETAGLARYRAVVGAASVCRCSKADTYAVVLIVCTAHVHMCSNVRAPGVFPFDNLGRGHALVYCIHKSSLLGQPLHGTGAQPSLSVRGPGSG
jgi:hypothetical protein